MHNASEAVVNVPFSKLLPELPPEGARVLHSANEVLGFYIRPTRLMAACIKLLQQYVLHRVTALLMLFQAGSSDAQIAD